MKRTIIYIVCITIITVICCIYSDNLVTLYYDTLKLFSGNDIKLEKNKYFREEEYLYVQNTVDFEPNNKNDIKNIFYTVINSGDSSFTFFCPMEYTNCLNDVKDLASDRTKLSHINNYVHPYNGFKRIEIRYTARGKVDIIITKNYSADEIAVINDKVEKIFEEVYNPNLDDIGNIKGFHDYIINNSKYDLDRSDYNMTTYKSDIAYGPLLQGRGVCGGYSDAMALFLEKIGVKNFKVSSYDHVWNAVYLNGHWYHLDLTWDDPVMSDRSDFLQHEYFIINTDKLLTLEQKEHDFDGDVYLEFKTN